jgi:hypothetical protein
MRPLLLAFVLIALFPIAEASELTAWKTASSWVAPSVPAAKEARATWFIFYGAEHPAERCPAPADPELASLAVPRVFTNPMQYPGYEPGAPESFLILPGDVSYPVLCDDGAVGWITVSQRDGSWEASAFQPPVTDGPYRELLDLRRADLQASGLGTEHYFSLMVLPVTLGTEHPFGGAFLLARQAGEDFQVAAAWPEPSLPLVAGEWLPADQVWLRLKAHQTTR